MLPKGGKYYFSPFFELDKTSLEKNVNNLRL
jgi:hypothetical protein